MLGFLPYNLKVKLIIKTSELDKWGKPVVSESVKEYKCYIREVTSLEEKFNSKELNLIMVFGIEGNSNIKAGDTVEADGVRYEVSKTRKIRDLSGEIITTLVYV